MILFSTPGPDILFQCRTEAQKLASINIQRRNCGVVWQVTMKSSQIATGLRRLNHETVCNELHTEHARSQISTRDLVYRFPVKM